MRLKDGYVAVLAMGLLGIAGAGPRFVQRQMLDRLARKATAVMTNVPGRSNRCTWPALASSASWSGCRSRATSASAYRYFLRWRRAVGLITDAALCPDPQEIIDRFAPEFEQLVHTLCCCHGTRRPIPTLPSACWLNTEQLAATATHSRNGSSTAIA